MKLNLFSQTVGRGIHLELRSLLTILLPCLVAVSGCKTPPQYRRQADEVAADIIEQKQREALGKADPLNILRPSDLLRRRLLTEQHLAYSGNASLGTDRLAPIAHWPDESYPPAVSSPDAGIPIEPNAPVKLSLIDVLQVAARNSPEYQSRKEDVFRAALDLDLQRNNFRNIFRAQVDSQMNMDTTGDHTVTTVNTGGTAGVTRTLKNGVDLSAALAVDLANLLTQGGASSLGLAGDASISVPLLRGAGRHIVTEPLTQAERNLLYEIWDFERFKRTFAVNVARDYYNVLNQIDRVKNSEVSYRSAVISARMSRRKGDAGRMDVLEVDEAVQQELGSRNNWISTQEQLKNRLDSFKATIGLPPDALIEVDRADLGQLRSRAETVIGETAAEPQREAAETAPPADAPVTLEPASDEGAGPYEIDERVAIGLALENRLDLRVAVGSVYDAQRDVVVSADALRTGLTIGGSAAFADDDDVDGSLHLTGGRYAALLALDLPIERTAERNAYRNSLINLERATRGVQTLEDQIKLAIRSELRTLLLSREGLKIQAQSVVLADKRVRSSTLFVEAGRREIRFLLDAQRALLSAQNELTQSLVDYRMAELEIQRDMGLLDVDERGLWQEFSPEEIDDGTEQ